MTFDIPHISKYKRGSNQYETKFRFLKKSTWLSIAIIMLVMLILVAVAFLLGQYQKKLSMFEHTPQSVFVYKHPVPTPIPTKRDIVFSQKHGDIIWHIYGLESSFGREPFLGCTKKGLVSDMGFNVLNHQCFSSFDEEVAAVEAWIEKRENMPIGKLLCVYNQGQANRSCDYAVNFLEL